MSSSTLSGSKARDARLDFYRQQASLGGINARKRAGDLYRVQKDALRAAVIEYDRSDLEALGGMGSAIEVMRVGVDTAVRELRQIDQAAQLNCAPRRLLPSLVHMHVNRISGGLHEFDESIIFGLLERTLRSARAVDR